MQIKLRSDGVRGPKGHIFEVYLKVYTGFEQHYYVTKGLEDDSGLYNNDTSSIQDDDEILYTHPEVTVYRPDDPHVLGPWQFGCRLPDGFTWIQDEDCEEVVIQNNQDALSLLET